MPKSTSKSRGGKLTRTVAPFAPLAVAMLLQTSVIPGGSGPDENGTDAVVCGDDIEGFRGCHSDYPTGCTAAGRYDAFLNLFKNQLIPPSQKPEKFYGKSDFADLNKNTPKELTKGNHEVFKDDLGKLGEGHVFGVNGFLYYAQKGGTKESSNCQLGPDLDDIDFHIGIGFDSKLAAKVMKKPGAKSKLTDDDKSALNQTSIVIEMTPHYRAQFKPDWTLDLVKSVVGRQVRVIGQLMADNEHNNKGDNCSYPGANQDHCWRFSIWELHPVTQFEVCGSADGTCEDDSADWVALEDFQAGGGK